MQPYHKNPRQITDDELADLRRWLAELGDLSGIVHDLNSDEIVGGNQRGRVFDINQCEIALVDGPHEPDEQGTVAHGFVVWQGNRYAYRQVRWTPRQCEKANIVANKAGGDWDAVILAAEFAPTDLVEWGFKDGELEELLRAAGIASPGADPGEPGDAEPQLDRAEELAVEWGVEPGQLWRLPSRVEGQYHLLICGDCTDPAVVQRLMDGQRATLFATDPPYLVDYDGTNHPQAWNAPPTKRDKNKNWSATYKDWDAAEQGEGLYDGFIGAAVAHAITENAAWYCWHASRRQAMLEAMWDKHGAFVHQQIVWVKDRPVLTRSFYMWQHEPCFYGWVRPNKPPRAVDEFHSTVWSFPTQTAFERTDHPTQKPLQLFEIPMTQHTRPGELVYEPFCGSGTQIVAAENLGRQCRAVEIAAPFVAVCLQRYLDAFEIRGELVE